MTPQEVYDWLRRDPFIPFRVNLSNGRHYDVRRPEMAMVGKRAMLVGELDPDFPLPVFESSTQVSLIHVNSIETIPQPAPAPAG